MAAGSRSATGPNPPEPGVTMSMTEPAGAAGKAQVTAMVTKILALQAKPTPADAADALALAICHCWRAPMLARMAEAEALAADHRKKFERKLKAASNADANEAKNR